VQSISTMFAFPVGGETEEGLAVLGRATTKSMLALACWPAILPLPSSIIMRCATGLGSSSRPGCFTASRLTCLTRSGFRKKLSNGRRAALGDDMEHVAALGLCPEPIDLEDDRACGEIFSFKMNPAAIIRPATGDETAHSDGTADHSKNQTGVVARSLQTEELQKRHSLSVLSPSLRPVTATIAIELKVEVQNVQISTLDLFRAVCGVSHVRP
jgi:hypothetical protein